ncbi:MAG: type II toxin-antitoxin system VapC family toxin [Acidobacteriota bacterium]|nr:type II toxin-antitoxin system VapC family toxin [Acidobacteriota bacterium]
MTRLLLDTSAYSAFMSGYIPVRAPVQEASELWLSATVLGELLAGFRKGNRTRENELRLRDFLAEPRVYFALIDGETAERYAVIHDHLRRAGTPVPVNDVWIAAAAFQRGLKLLTLDEHFRRIPQVHVVDVSSLPGL